MMVGQYFKRSIAVGTTLVALVVIGAFAIARSEGGKPLSVQSGSMVPAIKKGDLVIVKDVPHYQVGDVITYISPRDRNATITHRIIKINRNDTLQTKGDANQAADPVVPTSAIIGSVQHTIPLMGHAIDFVRQPLGLLLIIYVPALLIVAHELRLLTAHYKRLQPYLAPGRSLRRYKPTGKQRIALASKLVVLCTTLSLGVVIPARAALFSTASLTGNTIAAAPQSLTDHILLRRVEFECALDNTGEVNKLPSVIMHNPTDQDVPTGNWYLQSSRGRIETFRSRTVFDAHDDYDIEPDLIDGLRYQGDFLALFDATGKLIDAISWGTDTTYLNPSLPGVRDGSIFRRIDVKLVSNTVADWAVSVETCEP